MQCCYKRKFLIPLFWVLLCPYQEVHLTSTIHSSKFTQGTCTHILPYAKYVWYICKFLGCQQIRHFHYFTFEDHQSIKISWILSTHGYTYDVAKERSIQLYNYYFK